MENNHISQPAKGVALIIGAGENSQTFCPGGLYCLYDTTKCRQIKAFNC